MPIARFLGIVRAYFTLYTSTFLEIISWNNINLLPDWLIDQLINLCNPYETGNQQEQKIRDKSVIFWNVFSIA